MIGLTGTPLNPQNDSLCDSLSCRLSLRGSPGKSKKSHLLHLSFIIINSTLRGTSGKLQQKMIIDQNPIQVALTNITILL